VRCCREDDLKAWVGASLPRTTRQVGAWIEQHFGFVYESRSGLIALLDRLGLDYHKPNVSPRKLDEEAEGLHRELEKLLNSLAETRPCYSRTPCTRPMRRDLSAAGRPSKTSWRLSRPADVINIHGALDLATGQTRMIEVDGMSRTTNATPCLPNSPTRCSVFCAKRFLEIGPTCVIQSPTICAPNDFRVMA
jgi:hypothetical protein